MIQGKWNITTPKDANGFYLLATDDIGHRRATMERFKTRSLAESFLVNIAPPVEQWALHAPLPGSKAAKLWGF